MRYHPDDSPFKNYNFKSKRQLGKYLSLVKLDLSIKEKPYVCTICGLRFLTELGALNHVDFKHTEEVRRILN